MRLLRDRTAASGGGSAGASPGAGVFPLPAQLRGAQRGLIDLAWKQPGLACINRDHAQDRIGSRISHAGAFGSAGAR